MWRHFVASLRQPEWLTIYILGVQALIFIWQSFILRHHGHLIDRQAEISATQTEIAAYQSKIMDAQFAFEKTLHVNGERKAIFDLAFPVVVSVQRLLISLQDQRFSEEVLMETRKAWVDMQAKANLYGQALLASQYLSREESEHSRKYLNEVTELEPSNDRGRDAERVKAFVERHKDFLTKMRKQTDSSPSS